MNNLRRTIRQVHHSGSEMYGVVEAIHCGYATVRTQSGARMTNLAVVGGAVAQGSQVLIDYAGGVPPKVRPLPGELAGDSYTTGEIWNPFPNLEDIIPDGLEAFDSAKLYIESNSYMAADTYSYLDWDGVLWDSAKFFDARFPQRINLPTSGLYWIDLKLHISASADTEQALYVQIVNSNYDVLATKQQSPAPGVPYIRFDTGTLQTFSRDEFFMVRFYQTSKKKEPVELLADYPSWPAIVVQWMGPRNQVKANDPPNPFPRSVWGGDY